MDGEEPQVRRLGRERVVEADQVGVILRLHLTQVDRRAVGERDRSFHCSCPSQWRRTKLALRAASALPTREAARCGSRSTSAPCSRRSTRWRVVLDLVLGRGAARPQHDDRVHLLAPHRVRDADDGDLRDGGVGRDRVLDLDGVHVLAAGDDHVVQPVDEVDVAVGVDVADVAGVVPAAARTRALSVRGGASTRGGSFRRWRTPPPPSRGEQSSVFILDRELDPDDGAARPSAGCRRPRRGRRRTGT